MKKLVLSLLSICLLTLTVQASGLTPKKETKVIAGKKEKALEFDVKKEEGCDLAEDSKKNVEFKIAQPKPSEIKLQGASTGCDPDKEK